MPEMAAPRTLLALAVPAGAGLAGLVLARLLVWVAGRATRRTDVGWDEAFVDHLRGPVQALLPVLAAQAALPYASLAGPARTLLSRALLLASVLALGWAALAATHPLKAAVLRRFDVDVADNLRARKVHTQLEIVRKIVAAGIALATFAAALMTFPRFREIGAGLLASAGLAGLVLGFAAQRSLGNLLAGLQIAVTQPIRIDDVVIVEGEWGRVEEITLTYVVVRIWDLRRLILPISYFLEEPFQNWTRERADILGTVFLRVDYRTPVEEVRRELGRIVEESEWWDGEVWRLHVTDSGDRTLELRALMSAADSGDAWELRCQVREELVAWLQREHPDCLPRVRAETGPLPPDEP